MPLKSTRSRRLLVEGLESRAMLAGNVTVAVTDGVLRITGDVASNDIEIQQISQTFEGEWPGAKLQIIGHSTTINGQATPLTVEGVKRGAMIGLQNGNNRLLIGNVSTGATTKPVNLSGHVQIGTWKGNDNIRFSVNNGSRVTVNSGPGDDNITVARSNLDKLTVNADPIPVEGGLPVGGRDTVILRSVKAQGEVAITAGIADDEVKLKEKSTFSGAVSVDLGSSTVLNMLSVEAVTLNGASTFIGGVKGDSFELDGTFNGELSADLGAGKDFFTCFGRSTTILQVSLGEGNDSAHLFSEFLAGINLDGGIDTDTLYHRSTNPDGEETIVNFEIIEE